MVEYAGIISEIVALAFIAAVQIHWAIELKDTPNERD